MDEGFHRINAELERRATQRESTQGLDTPFRVEFRFKGSKAYEYFSSYDEALRAEDYKKCTYSIYGNPVITYPSSRQIQARGKRGGWHKYNQGKE